MGSNKNDQEFSPQPISPNIKLVYILSTAKMENGDRNECVLGY